MRVDRLLLCESPAIGKAVGDAMGDAPGLVVAAEGPFVRLAEPEEIEGLRGNTSVRGAVDQGGQMLSVVVRPPSGFYPLRLVDEGAEAPAGDANGVVTGRVQALSVVLRSARRVVLVAGPDGHGQALLEDVLRFLHHRGDVRRVGVHACDRVGLKAALDAPDDNAAWRVVYASAVARAQADRIFGATVWPVVRHALTLPSAGPPRPERLALAALGVICRREREGERAACGVEVLPYAFVRADEVYARLVHESAEGDRIWSHDQDAQDRALGSLRGWSGRIERVVEELEESAPALPDMAELHRRAASWGWDEGRTAHVAASLHERRGLITCPRSDLRSLPASMREELPLLHDALLLGPFAPSVPGRAHTWPGRSAHRLIDDVAGSRGRPHAIVPVLAAAQDWAQALDVLPADEARMFEAVARSALAAFGGARRLERHVVSIVVDGRRYERGAFAEREAGWAAAFEGADWACPEVVGPRARAAEWGAPLPDWGDGQRVEVDGTGCEPRSVAGVARMRGGDLIHALSRAERGGQVEGEAPPARVGRGWGTPPEREAVVAALIDGGWLDRTRRGLRSTIQGRALDDLLCGVEGGSGTPEAIGHEEECLERLMGGEGEPREVVDRVSSRAARIAQAIRERSPREPSPSWPDLDGRDPIGSGPAHGSISTGNEYERGRGRLEA